MPNGLDSKVGRLFEGGHDLSGGEWQRLALARIMYRDADIWILDEPTSSLDPEAEAAIFAELKENLKGRIGIVSKSGTLTYEAADQVAKAGLGISTAVGIGGDPIIGTTTKEAVELFMNDEGTDAIVMIGEIGGGMEAEAARWIRDSGNKKPVVGFIAGQTAPPGRRMGHAGAIVGGAEDTAAAKMKIMEECGIHVVQSPADIGKTMAQVMKGK